MKQSKVFPAIFLFCFLQIGCTDKIEPDVPFGKVQTTLNATELILKGRWYLRSMATADTIYQDSIFNRTRQIEFTNLSSSTDKMPILVDNAALAAKGTPLVARIQNDEIDYRAQSGTLEIRSSMWLIWNFTSTDFFQITSLSSNKLILSDTLQKKQWTFYR